MRTDSLTAGAPGRAVDTYVLNDADELLLMRHAFSHRPGAGAWTTSLHVHHGPDQDPVETARRLALSMLCLPLHHVAVLVPQTRLRSPVCPAAGPEPGSILLARTSRRVVTPDPTRYDDAGWVPADDDALLPPEVRGAIRAATGERP